jgi:DHA2 family multidrug resistance protein
MTMLFIFDPPYIRRTSQRIDYWGMGMLAVGIGALQVLLDKGQEQDWFASHWITGLLMVSLIALAAFVFHELRTPNPVVSLRVFKDRSYSAGVFLMTVLGFVLYGSLVLLPIWLQTLLGYPAVQAGIAMAPRGIGSFIGMTVIGRILGRFDPRKFLAMGLFVAALTLFQLSRMSLDAGYWDFFWPQFVQGLSLAMLFIPLTTVTMASIPREGMGNATSLFNLLRNLGGSIGIAGVTTLTARYQQVHTNVLGAHVSQYSGQTQALMSNLQAQMTTRSADSTAATHQSYAALFGMIQRQATILSYVDVFRLLGVIFLLMLPLVLLMKKPVHAKTDMPAH